MESSYISTSEIMDTHAQTKLNRLIKHHKLTGAYVTEMGLSLEFSNGESLHVEGVPEGFSDQPFLKYSYTERIKI